MLNRFRFIFLPLFLLPLIMFNAQNESPAPLATCPQDIIDEALAYSGMYTPSAAEGFISLEDEHFILDG